MALSAEARARLQAIVDHGFAPLLSIGLNEYEPEAGTNVTAFWDFSDLGHPGGHLRAGGRVWVVGPVGQRIIPVADSAVTVRLTVGDHIATAVAQPRVVVPVIATLAARGARVAASPVRIAWATRQAESAELIVLEAGEELMHESVEAEGERIITPARPGRITVHLVARSRHAQISERATVTREITVSIAPPPVQIEIVRVPTPGKPRELRFSWRILGAKKMFLFTPARNKRFRLDATGEVSATNQLLDEVLVFKAEALDGRVVTKTLRLTPEPPDVSLPIDLMNPLDRPWTDEAL